MKLPEKDRIPDPNPHTEIPDVPDVPPSGGLSPVTWRYIGLAVLAALIAIVAVWNVYG